MHMYLSEIQQFQTESNNTAFTPAGRHRKRFMIQKQSKPINAWRGSQQQTALQKGPKHASESTAGGPRKPHAWHAPARTSAEQLLTILLQLNINGPLLLQYAC